MASFDVFERAVDVDANATGESQHPLQVSSAAETFMTRKSSVHSVLAKSDASNTPNKANDGRPMAPSTSGVPDAISNAVDTDEEIVRLHGTVTDLKTAYKAKEILLRRTREELKNARETLNETFAEYCKLRDEMKTVKQTMSRDHQAVVYRKDIELFALRKGNEQKEKYIKEHDAKLEEVFQQQKATVELKDAQLKILKERLTRLDRQASPKFGHEYEENMEGDQALEVRLLRVKKGRSLSGPEDHTGTRTASPNTDDETIASLREQLAIAKKATEEVVNQQAELQRAWDITRKVQESLKEERALHAQTKEQLQELAIKIEEEQQRNRINSATRLPTIEEDKDELEAMFDTAQEDNVRLHAQIQLLEKRLHDANARMFTSEQAAEALRTQLRLEQAISEDLETARPSVVHRVHFQRMEGQLKESRDALMAKVEEIESLKKTIAGKEYYVKDLQAEIDAAVSFHTQDQDEIERLKQSVAELQATKEHLMRDHERLSRTRLRISSTDRASARSSGATLTQDLSPPLTRPSDETAPTETLPVTAPPAVDESNDSIQETPKRHIRSKSTPNRWSLISNDAPPPELRALKRRSLGLRDLVKKMVRKDPAPDATAEAMQGEGDALTERPKSRAVLATKDHNVPIRPSTAAPKVGAQDPFVSDSSTPLPEDIRPPNARKHTPRYYAIQSSNDKERPQTAAATKMSKDDSAGPTTKKSWVATNKLKRRSLY